MIITLPIIPRPQQRPRFCRQGKTVKTIDPSKGEKMVIRNAVRNVYFHEPLDCPLSLAVTFYVPIPKSYSKTKKKKAAAGEMMPSLKPDLDNYLKLLLDALNGILYKDDALIVSLQAQKRYSLDPRIDLTLESLHPV